MDVSYILEEERREREMSVNDFCDMFDMSYNTYYKRQQYGKHHRGYQLDSLIEHLKKLNYGVVIMDLDLYDELRNKGWCVK